MNGHTTLRGARVKDTRGHSSRYLPNSERESRLRMPIESKSSSQTDQENTISTFRNYYKSILNHGGERSLNLIFSVGRQKSAHLPKKDKRDYLKIINQLEQEWKNGEWGEMSQKKDSEGVSDEGD